MERTEVDARTAICALTRDVKFDIPLLRLALDLPVGHVGAMGSRRTHDERLRLLRAAGVPDDRLARLRSTIGLDLGARTAQATAVSITAESIAHTHHGSGLPLSGRTGPIHRTPAAEAVADLGQTPALRPAAPRRIERITRARGHSPSVCPG